MNAALMEKMADAVLDALDGPMKALNARITAQADEIAELRRTIADLEHKTEMAAERAVLSQRSLQMSLDEATAGLRRA